MTNSGVLTLDRGRDETASERFLANHRLACASFGVAAVAVLLYVVKLPPLSDYWGAVAGVAAVLLVLSLVLDPVLAVWTRWGVVAPDSGIIGRRSGAPARWAVYPSGWRSVVLIVSADSVLPEEWRDGADKLAQGFGYERVEIDHSRRRVRLRFTNAPSLLDSSQVMPLALHGDSVRLGIDEKGQAYDLDTHDQGGMVVGGIPGSGKTVMLRRMAATFAKNPANQVVIFDGKGTGDFSDLRAKNVEVIAGTPDDYDEEAAAKVGAKLDELMAEMRARAAGSTVAGPTPPRLVVIVDECQDFFPVSGLSKDAKAARARAENILGALVSKGRSLGIFTILATQKPDSGTIPTSLRDKCALRVCGRVRTPESAKMVLGEADPRALKLKRGQMIVDDGRGDLIPVKIALGF